MSPKVFTARLEKIFRTTDCSKMVSILMRETQPSTICKCNNNNSSRRKALWSNASTSEQRKQEMWTENENEKNKDYARNRKVYAAQSNIEQTMFNITNKDWKTNKWVSDQTKDIGHYGNNNKHEIDMCRSHQPQNGKYMELQHWE